VGKRSLQLDSIDLVKILCQIQRAASKRRRGRGSYMTVDCRISVGYLPVGYLGRLAAGRDYDGCRKGFDVAFLFFDRDAVHRKAHLWW
jgi:hypothetical protein